VGTSVNQKSPKTLSWQAVHATYRNKDIPIARVTSEVWRAATNQDRGDLARLLSAPIVAKVGQLTLKAKTPLELSRTTALEIVRSKSSSLASDIARRAAIQSMSSTNRMSAYNERVFAEATSYLVSRDFPGFVGIGRAQTIAESISFKAAVSKHVTQLVRDAGLPSSFTARNWGKYVRNVVTTLQGKTK
jgi:hypothetical protein